jgi:predicted transcriptional regulator
MATLTLRIPDDKHRRLEQLAESRGISVHQLIDELSTIALVASDAYTRFQALAEQGNVQTGLQLLDLIDARLANQRSSISSPTIATPITPHPHDRNCGLTDPIAPA